MNVFDFVGKQLRGLDNVRFEWSLKITPQAVALRPSALFWVTNYDRQDMRPAFSKLRALLDDLNCPAEITARARALALTSKTQGLLLPVCPGLALKKRLYVEYYPGPADQTKRIGLEWTAAKAAKEITYEFNAFTTDFAPGLLVHVHPGLRTILLELVDNTLLSRMGYYYQFINNQIHELYITYPWQPSFSSIIPQLSQLFPAIAHAEFHAYSNHCFRHIGFSNSTASAPVLTMYFSAKLGSAWPMDFESFQNTTKAESSLNSL